MTPMDELKASVNAIFSDSRDTPTSFETTAYYILEADIKLFSPHGYF